MNPPPRRSAPLQPAGATASPADVRQFIAAHQAATPAPAPVTAPQEMPLTPEMAEFIKNQQTGAGEQMPEPHIPLEAAADPELTGSATMRETALEVTGAAALTPADKDAFVLAALMDQPTVLMIPVLGTRAQVEVRTLSIMHEDILAWWLGRLEQNKSITSGARWMVMMQRAHVLLRVVSLRTADQAKVEPYTCQAVEQLVQECSKYKGPVNIDPTDGIVKGVGIAVPDEMRERAIRALDEHVVQTFRSMTPARYVLLQQAVGVHEQKFNALARMAASGNF